MTSPTHAPEPPRPLNRWLLAAAAYNLLWGASVVLFPDFWFRLAGLPLPLYPMIWQALGMVVGVYGIGYAIAAADPDRHWPIVLVGFLGKLFGPVGFAWHWWMGNLPGKAIWMNVGNDLIWLVPFALLLRGAYVRNGLRP